MDDVRVVLAPENKHLGRVIEDMSPSGIASTGDVGLLESCGTRGCDRNIKCHCWDSEDGATIFREQVSRTTESHDQRMNRFNFHQRVDSPSREPRRHSSSASPRTRPSPMYLSPFSTIGWPLESHWSQCSPLVGRDGASTSQPKRHPRSLPSQSQSWPPAAATTGLGVVIGITPPEDLDSFTWATPSRASAPCRQESLSSDLDNQSVAIPATNSSDRSTERPSTITLPLGDMMQGDGSPSTWLGRAVQIIVSLNGNAEPNSHMNMVVQTMPPHVERPASSTKLVFEDVVQSLQRSSANVPYVTITHVYTNRRDVSLEEIPDSPPATPNVHGGSYYFDNNMIFTHAAQLPDYHSPNKAAGNVIRNPKVAAPASVNVSTLERYIPPTTADEVRDFFSVSRRSHLVDRLSELTARQNGTLLLVYPTKTGGQTFAKWYKDPVLDPLLRQFMMLRGLTSPAGEALGNLGSVESLMDFDEMQAAIGQICTSLADQLPPVGGPSRFTIAHAEQADVILNRQTWIELFLAQESSRMKQDLIEYQKSGQRMPAQGFDASPAALAREIEDGIRSSKEHAGGVGIEVGVFVIQRSLL